MNRKSLLLILGFYLIGFEAFAQNAHQKWALGIGLSMRDFQGIPAGNLNQTLFKQGAYLYLGRYLGQSFDIGLDASVRTFDQSPNTPSPDDLSDFQLMLRYKLYNGYLFPENSVFGPYLTAGFGGINFNETFEFAVPFGAGLVFTPAERVSVDLSGIYHKSVSDFNDYFTINGGVRVNLGKSKPTPPPPPLPDPDRDGDGIVDADDRCPDDFGLSALQGCPDQDEDQVADIDDECPTEPGPVELAGCPDDDGDDDGVKDKDDKCPFTPGLAELDGCPDSDGDGIADPDDDCPQEAGLASLAGCPDRDEDGVSDGEDACPDQPGLPSLRGCPEIEEEVKEQLAFATRSVQFESGRAVLLQSSFPVLDTLVSIMNQYPGYHLRASGHTDSIGEADDNQELSEKRAKACMEYLISQGISPDRVIHVGFGESRPIADNMYAPGRKQNRRVEFELFLPE